MQSQILSASLLCVPTRMLVVGGLHLVLIWALINGLNVHPTSVERSPDMESVVTIERQMPPVANLIPPDPTQPQIHLVVPEPPLVNTTPDTTTPQPPSETGLLRPLPEGSGTAKPEPVIAAAAVDPHRPLTQPPYPPASIRSGEQGTLALDVLVGIDGHVRDARVSRSSGSSRLDQAAVNEARLRWRLRPATRDGAPFEQWLTLRVVFRLEDR